MNCLIVDDSAIMRSILKKAIQMSGLQIDNIYTASNGQEGLDSLGNNSVDVIFLDINMPIMNGEEMLKASREDDRFASIPVIIVSTEGSATRLDEMKEMGARFIHKPFTPEEIVEKVNEIL